MLWHGPWAWRCAREAAPTMTVDRVLVYYICVARLDIFYMCFYSETCGSYGGVGPRMMARCDAGDSWPRPPPRPRTRDVSTSRFAAVPAPRADTRLPARRPPARSLRRCIVPDARWSAGHRPVLGHVRRGESCGSQSAPARVGAGGAGGRAPASPVRRCETVKIGPAHECAMILRGFWHRIYRNTPLDL